MISDYFYYALWLLTHAVVALITQTRDVYHLVHHRFTRFISTCRGDEFHLYQPLKKLPEHVTVLLPSTQGPSGFLGFSGYSSTNRSTQIDVLVNIVLWCLATNISFVSFYDPLGLLIKKEEELMQQIQNKMDKSHRLIFHGMNNSGKNGFSGPKIHVKIIGTGRSSIVDSCRQLARVNEVLTVPIVSKNLQINYEFPDPQLAIYFGEYLNLCGYPPWQIRLAEFLHGGKNVNAFDQRRFEAVLMRYSKCQQRVGK